MLLRIEFTASKSLNFPWVLRLCKKFPTFKEVDDEGLRVYSVDFEMKDMMSFRAIYNRVSNWRTAAFYLDGKLISAHDLFFKVNSIDAARRREELAKAAALLDRLLRKPDSEE